VAAAANKRIIIIMSKYLSSRELIRKTATRETIFGLKKKI